MTEPKFYYINNTYGLNIRVGQRVTMKGKHGVVKEDLGNHVGVSFDDNPEIIAPCHPTWEMTYHD